LTPPPPEIVVPTLSLVLVDGTRNSIAIGSAFRFAYGDFVSYVGIISEINQKSALSGTSLYCPKALNSGRLSHRVH
jgi:hypothetical protein